MKETEYITTLRSRFYQKYPSGFFYKIPDSHDGGQRPYDGFWLIGGGKFSAFEAKMHKSLSPWHFKSIAPHQISNLRIVRANEADAYVILGVRALTKKFDRKRIGKDLTRVSMDIFIPVEAIPGDQDKITLSKLDIRSLAASIDLKGSRVNEVYMSEDRLAEFAS